MENPEHWPFTEVGEICGAIAVKSPQVKGLDAALMEVDAQASDFETRLRLLRDAAMPNAGQTAARIVEAVAADDSALIDPATVTEVPWELQPGREPLD